MSDAVDVVVAGGGMAGLTAALEAATAGARVLVVEKADHLGGSARLSGGLVWTDPTYELFRARNPMGDPDLARVLLDGYDDGIAWLQSHGAQMTERLSGLFGPGEGHRLQPDMPTFVELMAGAVRDAGGSIELDVALRDVLLDETGAACGIRVLGPGGFRTIEAGSVVLTTGGFPAGRELLARWVTTNADRLVTRSNRMSTGDGLRAGMAAGAATSGGLHAFYGHLLPAPPARITPETFIPLTQYYSVEAVLVNVRGDRFVDESEADDVSAQALARQPEALGFLILDRSLDDAVTAPPAAAFPRMDRHGEIERAGGRILRADSLEGLEPLIDAAGGNGWATTRTVEAYNSLVDSHPERLPIPRARRRNALRVPSFTAVPVIPAVTLTHGGLKIDESARVLDLAGRPIPGLFAAGGDGGGLYCERYAGALSMCLVFGRVAGAGASRVRRRHLPRTKEAEQA
jgi:succinate dehydrogenase/fumarate reductase flavoprotein subunit